MTESPRATDERAPSEPGSWSASHAGSLLVACVLLLLVFGAVVWWLWPTNSGLRMEDSIEETVAWIQSWGAWAAACSITLMVAHSFLPFPSEIIALANGMVFGPLWGTVITWVGAMLGATSTFALVRMLGRPFVYRMLSARQITQLTDWSSRRGGAALLIGRLIPVIAFNLLNYSAALTGISWWTFIWATALGILPLTIILNVFGNNMLTMPAWAWVLLLLGALGTGVWMLLKRRAGAGSGR